MNENEQLNRYIDDPQHNQSPDAQTQQVVDQLQRQVESVEPRPQFVQELSSRLQAEARHAPSPRSLTDWLVLRFVPRLVGGTAVVALVLFLAWGLPKLWQQWDNPTLEPVVSGDVVPATDRVTAVSTETFPEVPAQLPLYQIEFKPLPITAVDAVAWAADFGIPDPQAYTDPRQPGMIQVIGSSDESLMFQSFQPGTVMYSINQGRFADLEMNQLTAEPLSFAAAADIAVSFLAAHDLLPADYQVIDDEASGFDSQDSIRSVSIGPNLSDDYTITAMGGLPGTTVLVAADGQVVFTIFTFLDATPGELVEIIPAQEAYAAYQAGELGTWGTEMAMVDQNILAVETFTPPSPTHQVGDEVEVIGWPTVLVAAEGGEVRATLNAYPPATYHLVGDKIRELVDIQATTGDVVVRGIMTAVITPGEWELTVTDWEVSPPAYSSYAPFSCLKGAFSRETADDWLTDDEGMRYRLPDAPAELNEGDRIEVCPEIPPTANADVTWLSITRPPASEAVMSERGVSMTVVEVTQVVEGEPMPIPTLTVPEHDTDTAVLPADSGTASGFGGSFLLPSHLSELPYELGKSVSLTGTVDAVIFDEGDGRLRYQVTLQLLDKQGLITTTLPLSATTAILQEIAEGYYGRFLSVNGEIVSYVDWPGSAVTVESFTAVWPDVGLQNFLGHIELETIEGVHTAVFIDHATDHRYLIARETVPYSENDPLITAPQILISGIFNPGKMIVGLPVLIVRSASYDSFIAQAENISDIPAVNEPQIVPAYHDPLTSAEEMVLERMELTYYFEPTYDSVPSPSNSGSPSGPPPLAAKQTAQPVWVIHGRSPDGLMIYKIYVVATREN